MFHVLLWNADVFVFKLLLSSGGGVFCSFSVVRGRESASNGGITGGKWFFVCLRGGYIAAFSVCQDLVKNFKKNLKMQ